MVGERIKPRINGRVNGARELVSTVVGNTMGLLGDLKERFDLDTRVPKSLIVDIPTDRARNLSNLISQTEKNFAINNRRGIL